MHMPKRLLFAVAAIAGSLAAQTPTITGIVNGASAIPPGLPNYAIAQGSIFVVYGSNLGAAAPAGSLANEATLPLPTTGLAGTSIAVTVNGVTLPVPMLYTIPGQVAAIMPSATPAGTGTLTVTYNGNSATGPVTVQISAFGISNLRTPAGHEIPAVTFGTNQTELVSDADAAAPGDILVMYGTGLGPSIGGVDTGVPVTGNLGTAPTVYVGGVASPEVAYYGRSPSLPGLDQIVFTVPQNAPLGCEVSIVVETSNVGVPIVSNGPATAIGAVDHAPCVDPVDAFTSLLGSPANSTVLGISLQQNTTFTSATASTTSDAYQILAAQFTPTQFLDLSANMAESSNNSCFSGFVPAVAPPAGLPPAIFLDAGPSLTLTPPSGAPVAVPAALPGVYLAKNSLGIPPGSWGFTAPGGAGVGPLNFSFPIPQPITWTNQASLLGSTVTRANGLTINWTGGNSNNGFVDIQGFAANATGTFLVGYDCSAPIAAGSFTVPPSILLQMPTGPGASATLQVSTFALPLTTGPVTGVNAVVNFSQLQTLIPIVYQ
jgi:uncharacterized protein (TIGR03437 family)